MATTINGGNYAQPPILRGVRPITTTGNLAGSTQIQDSFVANSDDKQNLQMMRLRQMALTSPAPTSGNSSDFIQQLQKNFNTLDKDHNGKLTVRELQEASEVGSREQRAVAKSILTMMAEPNWDKQLNSSKEFTKADLERFGAYAKSSPQGRLYMDRTYGELLATVKDHVSGEQTDELREGNLACDQSRRMRALSSGQRADSDLRLKKELSELEQEAHSKGLSWTAADSKKYVQAYQSRSEYQKQVAKEQSDTQNLARQQKNLSGKVEHLLEVGGNPEQAEQSLKGLVAGYKDLATSGEAKDSLQFASKVLSDKNSKLYKATQKAGLLGTLHKDVLETSLPFAASRALKDNGGSAKKAVAELRAETGGLIDAKNPNLSPEALLEGKELRNALEQIETRTHQENQLKEIGGNKDATLGAKGLMRDLSNGKIPGSNGLRALGLVFALSHGLQAEGPEASSALLDGSSLTAEMSKDLSTALKAHVSTSRYLSGVVGAGQALGRVAPLLGAASAACTLPGDLQKAMDDATAPNVAGVIGDGLGVAAGGAALAGAEPLALGLGVASGTAKLGGWAYETAERRVKMNNEKSELRQLFPDKFIQMQDAERRRAQERFGDRR